MRQRKKNLHYTLTDAEMRQMKNNRARTQTSKRSYEKYEKKKAHAPRTQCTSRNISHREREKEEELTFGVVHLIAVLHAKLVKKSTNRV